MNRIILASLLIIVILSAGCTVDKTSELAPATPGSLQPVSIHQTIVPVTPSITDSITGNVTNGTGVGNKSLSSQTGDLFLIAPMNSRFYEGDVITINGTTILAAGDPLLVEVVSSSFGPTVKNNRQFFTGVSGVVYIVQGPPGGPNTWSFSFPTDGFTLDTYIVTVSGLSVKVEDSTTFDLLPRMV